MENYRILQGFFLKQLPVIEKLYIDELKFIKYRLNQYFDVVLKDMNNFKAFVNELAK
jgi:uncharacterized protein HemX